MELKELLPSNIQINLTKLNFPLFFRPITLRDGVWMSETFPGTILEDAFNSLTDRAKIYPSLKIISKLFAETLDNESKKKLSNYTIEVIDEFGIAEEMKLTISEKLLYICDDSDMMTLINAYTQIKTMSNDKVIKRVQEIEEKKTEQLDGK